MHIGTPLQQHMYASRHVGIKTWLRTRFPANPTPSNCSGGVVSFHCGVLRLLLAQNTHCIYINVLVRRSTHSLMVRHTWGGVRLNTRTRRYLPGISAFPTQPSYYLVCSCETMCCLEATRDVRDKAGFKERRHRSECHAHH